MKPLLAPLILAVLPNTIAKAAKRVGVTDGTVARYLKFLMADGYAQRYGRGFRATAKALPPGWRPATSATETARSERNRRERYARDDRMTQCFRALASGLYGEGPK